MTTIEVERRPEQLTPPPSTLEGVVYSPRPCPNCDNLTVKTTTAQSGDPAPTMDGKPVKPGQTIALCDSCGVTVKTGPASGAPKDSAQKAPENKRPRVQTRRRRPPKPSARKTAGKQPGHSSAKSAPGGKAAIGGVAAGPETGPTAEGEQIETGGPASQTPAPKPATRRKSSAKPAARRKSSSTGKSKRGGKS